MTLSVGALFAGYGGLELALQQVLPDTRLAWVAEYDKAPSKILAHHWPDVPNLRDVTKVDWHDVEPVDIITGGSPCQDLSNAGTRTGMTEGTRSNLWVQMREAIAVLQPQLVIWENVRGAFSAPADSALEPCPGCVGDEPGVHLRALGRVLGDFCSLGYDTSWKSLRAADIGAPHHRYRVFVVAELVDRERVRPAWRLAPRRAATHRALSYPARTKPAEEHTYSLLPTPAVNDMGDGKTVEWWDDWAPRQKASDGSSSPHSPSLSIEVQRLLPTPIASEGNEPPEAWDERTDRGLVAREHLSTSVQRLMPTPGAFDGDRGGPQHPDKRRAGGHSVNLRDAVHGMNEPQRLLPTPTVADDRTNEIKRASHRPDDIDMLYRALTDLLPTPTGQDSNSSGGGYTGQNNVTLTDATVRQTEKWGRYADAITVWENITRPAPEATETNDKGKPRLSAAFSEWLMGLPKGWVVDVPELTWRQKIKALGNGVVPAQAAAAINDALTTLDHTIARDEMCGYCGWSAQAETPQCDGCTIKTLLTAED